MKTKSISAIITLSSVLALGACSKKEEPKQTKPSGPQSTQGQVLEFAQKTVDQVNERTRKMEKDIEDAGE